MRSKLLLAMVMALALLLAACTGGGEDVDEPALPDDGEDVAVGEDDEDEDVAQAPAGNGKLAEVQDRGVLRCGVNDAVPGFGFLGAEGELEGFDVDMCRVIAAAVLGDADAVELIPTAVGDRFTSLQSDEIDVLSRNTTWTAARDATEGAAFAVTTYYDGQGMMVRADDGFGSIDEMENTIVCTLEGTTTELNLATRFTGIEYEPLTFGDTDSLQEAFVAESCDGWTSDLSQLAARRAVFPEEAGGPDSLVIFEEVFSKEPLGPLVADGDSQWYDAVNWAIIATIQAEEFGISSANVDDFTGSEDPDVLRFLGLPQIEGDEEGQVFDPGLGLPTDMNQQIVRQVGNYAELFEQHLEPIGLERGVNRLWSDGGLLYPPPYR